MTNTARMPEWNNSTLTTLERCGEMFRRRYIEREFIPPAPRMLRGTVVHRVAAETMLRKLEKDEPAVTVEEARDLAATDFEQRWAGGVSLQDVESRELGPVRAKAESKDFAVDLSAFYVDGVAPGIEPVAVERRIVVRPKDSDLVLHGTVDLVERIPDPDPEKVREAIRDTKTSEKTPRADAAERSQQLTMYAMIRGAETGQLPERMTLDYLVRTPQRHERKHVPLVTTRDGADVSALVNRINTAVEAVKRGVFMPTAPDSWWCSKEWCDYHSTCVYVRRGQRPQN
jgi:PD-(D/E)XK nuclease superfamily